MKNIVKNIGICICALIIFLVGFIYVSADRTIDSKSSSINEPLEAKAYFKIQESDASLIDIQIEKISEDKVNLRLINTTKEEQFLTNSYTYKHFNAFIEQYVDEKVSDITDIIILAPEESITYTLDIDVKPGKYLIEYQGLEFEFECSCQNDICNKSC